MRRHRLLVMVMALVIACGGDGGESTDVDGTADGVVEEVVDETAVDGDGLEIDNCALLTNEEASELAGEELEAAEDSSLGCPYVIPGEVIGEFTIRGYRGTGDSASEAEALVPDAVDVFPVAGVGDDATAISSSGDGVDFIIARQGDLFILLNTTFLFFEPDSPEMDKATALAGVALQRLVSSS